MHDICQNSKLAGDARRTLRLKLTRAAVDRRGIVVPIPLTEASQYSIDLLRLSLEVELVAESPVRDLRDEPCSCAVK